jgi:hypothetical protein
MKLEDRPLVEILPLVPSRLHLKFRLLGVTTIADVLAIDPGRFARKNGIGTNSVQQLIGLQEDLKKNPRKFLEHIKQGIASQQLKDVLHQNRSSTALSPVLVPESIDPERSFLQNFMVFEERYARLSEKWEGTNERDHIIIRQIFGINGQKIQMAAVGRNYDITREAVRQIRLRHLAGLSDLLSGESLSKPLRRCPVELVRQFLSFRQEHVANKGVILRSNILASSPGPEGVSDPHLDLLMASLGYANARYREYDLFYDIRRFNHQTLRKSIMAVARVLQDEVYPVAGREIEIRLKREYGDSCLSKEVVFDILGEIPDL